MHFKIPTKVFKKFEKGTLTSYQTVEWKPPSSQIARSENVWQESAKRHNTVMQKKNQKINIFLKLIECLSAKVT